jgi:hypothetical protein
MQCRDIISIILPGKQKVGIHGRIARKRSERLKHILISMRSIATEEDPAEQEGSE